jgi:hypothetical protein
MMVLAAHKSGGRIQLQLGQGGWILYGWSEREQRVGVEVTRPETVVTGLG